MKRKALGWALLAAAMLAFAASAGAVDGTVEINQAVVTAAGGFPYVISTAGTSYRLTGSLTVSSGADAIDVNTSHVTIDLNGFSIGGPGTNSGNGIYGPSAVALVVENGTITGFGGLNGVTTGDNGMVNSVHVASDNNGITTGSGSVIEGCTANSNGLFDIYAGGGSVISGNTANSATVGIECNGSGCAILGNIIDSNSINGIQASDGTTGYGGNVLTGNKAIAVGGTSIGNNICSGSLC